MCFFSFLSHPPPFRGLGSGWVGLLEIRGVEVKGVLVRIFS